MEKVQKIVEILRKNKEIIQKLVNEKYLLEREISNSKQKLLKAAQLYQERILIADSGSFQGTIDALNYLYNEISLFPKIDLLIRPVEFEKYTGDNRFTTIHLIPSKFKERILLLWKLRKMRFDKALIIVNGTDAHYKFRLFVALLGIKEIYVWDGKVPIYKTTSSKLLKYLFVGGRSKFSFFKKTIISIGGLILLPFTFIYLLGFYLFTKWKQRIKENKK